MAPEMPRPQEPRSSWIDLALALGRRRGRWRGRRWLRRLRRWFLLLLIILILILPLLLVVVLIFSSSHDCLL